MWMTNLAIASLAVSTAFGSAEVEREPTKIGAWIDAGQIWKGTLDFDEKVDKQVVTRSKVALTQSTTIDDRLRLTGGVGGLFFYSLPVTESPHTRLTKFTAVLEEASGAYTAGDLDDPWMRLKFGLFFYKYNPDSKNLGEYLLRSGTYPGYLQTGGWFLINSAGYFGQGINASFNFLEGALTTDLLAFMERDYEPTYDISPSVVVSYRGGNIFTLGAGATFSHLISAKPSITSPENGQIAYRKNAITNEYELLGSDEAFLDSLTGVSYFTFKGTKLMARAAFNPQGILESDLLGPEDLKIYAEIALLGVKDYPIFFDNMAKRMPMLFGVNLPTFNVLDMLSFELEYYNSDFPNSIAEVYKRTLPIPGSIGDIDTRSDYVAALGTQRKLRDKVKWTLYLKKQLAEGLGIYFQAASDHFRPIDFNINPTEEPVTQTWSDWYYIVRLNFGI
jgi:hypothetical protein